MSAAAPDTSAATPLAADADDRLHAVDTIRGLALCFMILVHFHQVLPVTGEVPNDGTLAWYANETLGWAIWILVEQKAWGTFALLFGAGFALFLRRLEARGAPVVPIFLRRMAALAAIGWLMERYLDFAILVEYAKWGVVLLLVRRWSTRALFALGLAAVVARPVTVVILALVSEPGGPTQRPEWFGQLPGNNLALFILGLLAVRHGLLDAPLRHRRTIEGWMLFGVASWLLHWTAGFLIPGGWPTARLAWPVQSVLGLIEDQWFCLVYAGGALLLLVRHPALQARLGPTVGMAGRMALSNYVLQAVVIWTLATPLGLKLRPIVYVPMWIALFAAQVIASRQWLVHFRFGPLEWLWRMASYWRWQPIRRGQVMRARAAAA